MPKRWSTTGETTQKSTPFLPLFLSDLIRKIIIDAEHYKFSEEYHREHYEHNKYRTVSGDPYKVFLPENLPRVLDMTRPAPLANINENMAHEIEYESEDFDYQPAEPKMQHYKKRGGHLIWYVASAFPIIFTWLELFYSKFPSDTHFKKPLPPPLDFPDTTLSPDTEYYNESKTLTFKLMYENGSVNEFPFEIVDGQKVFKKFVGLNQPRPFI